MSLALPPNTLFSIIVLMPLVFAVVLIVWVTRRDRKKWAYRQQMGDMLLDRLKQANAEVSALVKAENDAIQSIAVLPEDVDPLEAERVLRAAMPQSSFYDRRALMVHAWEVQKRPQALVTLAGMALADLENTYSHLNLVFRTILNEGSPALLDHIARELDQRRDALDNWLRLSLPFQLERAAKRIETEAPDVSTRVKALAESLTPRWRDLLMSQLQFEIASWEEKDDVDPMEMAAALAKASVPRFPELVSEVHDALDQHDGPEWEKAHAWFDKAVLQRFYDLPVGLNGFSFDASVVRLCDGIMSSDAEVSRFVAEQAADMLSDGFFEAPHYCDALLRALDWAVGLHGTNPTYDWLDDALNPDDRRAEKAVAATESIAMHAQINAGVGTLVESTSTFDPEVALAELRQIMPDAPAEMLRVAFIARWKQDHSPMSLMGLLGVALEATLAEPVDGKLVSLCLHWPLRDGSAEIVAAAVQMLETRFEHLDGWLHLERSMIDLESAGERLAAVAPETASRVGGLLERAKARRVLVLTTSIAARVEQAVADGEAADPFRFVLDVYRWCLPSYPALGVPVRSLLRARNERAEWRKAQFRLEAMIVKHFAPLGQMHGYDFGALLGLLYDGITDHDYAVAMIAAATACDMVKEGYYSDPKDLLTLEGAVEWAVPLHNVPPPTFEDLRNQIRSAY